MVKTAFSKIQDSFMGRHFPMKPTLDMQRLAIRYLARLKEGNILFHTKYSMIVISFEDCNIHTKSSLIIDCIEKSIKNRHISRFWSSIHQTLGINSNYVCLEGQSDRLCQYAVSINPHDIQLIENINAYDERFKHGNRKRYTRTKI